MCVSLHQHQRERGQATIAMVGVVGLAIAAVVVLSIFSEAIVHRSRARNAADAVALAAAADSTAADALVAWYGDRNVVVERNGPQTVARSGPSQAAAWASTQPATTQPAPALVAIIARAEQLLGTVFASVQFRSTAVTLASHEAATMRSVATDLGLCEQQSGATDPGSVVFELC